MLIKNVKYFFNDNLECGKRWGGAPSARLGLAIGRVETFPGGPLPLEGRWLALVCCKTTQDLIMSRSQVQIRTQ